MGTAIIPKRLAEARELIGHNRKSFSEMLNIPYRTITNYENGSREPGSEYLSKVADVCGCTTDWLLGLSDDPNPNSPLSLLEANSVFKVLSENFELLNEEGQEKLLDYSDDLVRSGKYKKRIPTGLLQENA